MEEGERAAEIDQRVVAAELVQHDVIGVDAMDRGLGRGEPIERGERRFPDLRGQGGFFKNGSERPRGACLRTSDGHDVDVGRGQAQALGGGHLDPDVEPERVDGGVERRPRRAGVEQRGHEHVAGEPPDRVEMGDACHGDATSARRAMRAAIEPAPSPSSIPTTARPSAQEHNMR